MKVVRWIFIALTIGALSFALGEWVPRTNLAQWIELRAYDIRFPLRGALSELQDPEIVLVEIDRDTLDRIDTPLMFWHPHLAAALEAFRLGQARAVGIDLLLSDTSAYDPAGQSRLVQALISAQGELPVVLAYRADPHERDDPPLLFRMIQGPDGFGFANLTTDPDDFVRRQELLAAESSSGSHAQSFPGALLRSSLPDPPEAPASTILINYRGPKFFSKISFWQVLEALAEGKTDLLRDHFRNKIVLVGIGGASDLHPTPLYYWQSGESVRRYRRTHGVEIHAHTLATLISGNYITPASSRLQRTLAIFFVLAGLVLGLRFDPLRALLGFVLLSVLFLYVALMPSFSSGLWIALVGPLTAGTSALLASQGTAYLLQGRRKRKLQSLFQRYVSPDVIQEMVERPEELVLKGQALEVSILFSDLRNFTRLSESMEAAELVQLLNRYLGEMVQVIQQEGGMVDKFIGDAVMAVFGAPLPNPSHADQAVRAAVRMQASLERFNGQLDEEGYEPLRMGIGIHSGEAIVGNIGSSERVEYTAIGDVVNTAARLESLTKHLAADILISQATRERLQGKYACESLGKTNLKGKSDSVQVYRVEGFEG